MNGHSLANLDPLGLDNRPAPIELDPALYGFTEADLDKECVAQKVARKREALAARKKCNARRAAGAPLRRVLALQQRAALRLCHAQAASARSW